MKKLIILFFALFLFSCCPEKKKNTQLKEENTSNETVKSDSSRFKTIIREYKELTDEDFEFDLNDFEEEFGPV